MYEDAYIESPDNIVKAVTSVFLKNNQTCANELICNSDVLYLHCYMEKELASAIQEDYITSLITTDCRYEEIYFTSTSITRFQYYLASAKVSRFLEAYWGFYLHLRGKTGVKLRVVGQYPLFVTSLTHLR